MQDEVNKSQESVYQTRAGFVRPRPLSAPDLSAYTPTPQVPTSSKSLSSAYKDLERASSRCRSRYSESEQCSINTLDHISKINKYILQHCIFNNIEICRERMSFASFYQVYVYKLIYLMSFFVSMVFDHCVAAHFWNCI